MDFQEAYSQISLMDPPEALMEFLGLLQCAQDADDDYWVSTILLAVSYLESLLGQHLEALAHLHRLRKMDIDIFSPSAKHVMFTCMRNSLLDLAGWENVGLDTLRKVAQQTSQESRAFKSDCILTDGFELQMLDACGMSVSPENAPVHNLECLRELGNTEHYRESDAVCNHERHRVFLLGMHLAGEGIWILQNQFDAEGLCGACGHPRVGPLALWLEILRDHAPQHTIAEELWNFALERSVKVLGNAGVKAFDGLPILAWARPDERDQRLKRILDATAKNLVSRNAVDRIRAAVSLARWWLRTEPDESFPLQELPSELPLVPGRDARRTVVRTLWSLGRQSARELDRRNGNDTYSQSARRFLRHGQWRERPRLEGEITWPNTVIPERKLKEEEEMGPF